MDRLTPRTLLRAGCCFVLLAMCVLPARQACAQSREYQVKAAFLFHFAHFVEWPSSTSTNAAPFCIGVLGNNPFGNALDRMVRGEAIAGHKIAIKYSRTVDDLESCRIVFIDKSEMPHMSDILKKLNNRAILTVSDYDDFARRGGVINFYLTDGKVHFEINPDAAQREQLKISSQLLRLARIVRSLPVKKG